VGRIDWAYPWGRVPGKTLGVTQRSDSERIADLERRLKDVLKENASLREENARLRRAIEEWPRGHRERGKRRSSQPKGPRATEPSQAWSQVGSSWHQARGTIAEVQLGPSAKALAVSLRFEYWMPLRGIASVFGEWFGLSVTAGGLFQSLDKWRKRSPESYAEIESRRHA